MPTLPVSVIAIVLAVVVLLGVMYVVWSFHKLFADPQLKVPEVSLVRTWPATVAGARGKVQVAFLVCVPVVKDVQKALSPAEKSFMVPAVLAVPPVLSSPKDRPVEPATCKAVPGPVVPMPTLSAK